MSHGGRSNGSSSYPSETSYSRSQPDYYGRDDMNAYSGGGGGASSNGASEYHRNGDGYRYPGAVSSGDVPSREEHSRSYTGFFTRRQGLEFIVATSSRLSSVLYN